MTEDYIYSTPMFVLHKDDYGIEMDMFVSCNRVSEDNYPIPYPEEVGTTIKEYYEGLDELDMDAIYLNGKR